MSMLSNLLHRKSVELEIVQATHNRRYKDPQEEALHRDLIAQYCAIRKQYKKHDATYPEGLGIPGDMEAGFLLAVDHSSGSPKVVAGFRLNEVPAGKPVPAEGELSDDQLGVQADKIQPSRVENLFPGINRAEHAILNIDGAMFDAHANPRVLAAAINSLLESMVELAKARGYDAITLIPGTKDKLDRRITKFYAAHDYLKEHSIPITDHGTVTRKGTEKRVLCVTLDPKLVALLDENAERVAAR